MRGWSGFQTAGTSGAYCLPCAAGLRGGGSGAGAVRVRSERVRTYNYKENRISDHRVGYTAYNLDRVLDGELEPVLDILHRADMERLLAEVGEPAAQ